MATLNRFQFQKGKAGNNVLMSLERYAEIITTFPYEVAPKSQTLWIPFYSSNRTATLNLNHEVTGFENNTGFLVGLNGNCETPYYIIAVSPAWTNETVNLLAEKLVEKLHLEQHKSSPLRALKASRIKEIITLISEDKSLSHD